MGNPSVVVADTYSVHPNNILNWRKQLLEGAVRLFPVKWTDITTKAEERTTAALEAKLKQKDEVIAELSHIKKRVPA
jgi:transposase-like protein